MNLPKFKNYISNIITGCLFEHVSPYEESLYSKDSHFEVSPLNMPHHTKEEMALYNNTYKENQKIIESLSKSPKEENILNGDFSFIMKLDSYSVGTGVSLDSLIKMSQKLHTTLIFVNGDGNDYQLSEYTGGHDSEVILHVQFKGVKSELISDYKKWYLEREQFLKEKIEAKNLKLKNKR